MKTTSAPDPLRIDMEYRPASYFWPVSADKHALTHVQGTMRRDLLAAAAKKAQPVADELARPRLSDATRSQLGFIHPSCMGGEFLARTKEAEIEIARIELTSTTYDVTSLCARPGANRIHYRVVDEYQGDTLSERWRRTSTKPLTLREMTNFFLQGWDLLRVLRVNFDDDGKNTDKMMAFFKGSSAHYAQFDAHLRQRVVDAFRDSSRHGLRQ